MRLSSFKIGDGPRATVLLHGFLGMGKNLRTLAQRWIERDPSRTILIPDLSGHGTSPPVSGDTDLKAMARDVLETARAEGLDGPLEIVGHSLGGRVALAATLVAPEQVEKVVLLDISPSPIHTAVSESGKVLDLLLQAPASASDRKELRDALTSRGLSAALADWLMMNVVNENGSYRWRFDREALRDLHARVNQEDLWEAVERPGANVSCIRGGRSPYVSDSDVQRLERAGCWVETLPNAGHYVHVEALDALLDLLSRED